MKEYYLSEEIIDKVSALVAREDNDKFATCACISDIWDELGDGITARMAKKEGWKPGEAKGRAHRKFLGSLAAHCGLGYQSMNNRQRVGDNFIKRGLTGGENENISYQKFVALLANAEKDDTGLVQVAVLEERIKWVQEQTDKFAGQVPSVLDIQKEYRKNGHLTEEVARWKKIVYQAKEIEKIGHYEDARIMLLVLEIVRLDEEIEQEIIDACKEEE